MPRTLEEKMLDPQRAIRSVSLEPERLLLAAVAVVCLEAALVIATPGIFALWGRIISLCMRFAGLPGQVMTEPWVVFPWSGIRTPMVELSAAVPSGWTWGSIAYGTLAAWLAATFLPDTLLPLAYGIRFLCAVEASALVYFAWAPALYSYDITHFVRTEMNVGYSFLLLIPLLLGISYFTLEFGAAKKLGLVLATLAYYLIAVPIQVMACAAVVHVLSLAVLPVFYLAMGPLVFVAWFIAFYSWGMGWEAS